MRLLVTIEVPGSNGAPVTRHDVVLGYAPETTVRDLATALTGQPATVPANVVALPGAAAVPTLTGPRDLYLGRHRLDPEETVDGSAIRHGVVLGLGGPSTQREQEPEGLVEIRISSGPGAGHVHRLGVGRATLGHGRHCTIRIPELAEDPLLADVEEVLRLEVDTDGAAHPAPRPRPGRPRDAGAAAARAGDRADRAGGELDRGGPQAPVLDAQAEDRRGVPARRAHRPGLRRTRRAPGPPARLGLDAVGGQPGAGRRPGAARAHRDHRPGRLAERQPVLPRARLQPAARGCTRPRGRPSSRCRTSRTGPRRRRSRS